VAPVDADVDVGGHGHGRVLAASAVAVVVAAAATADAAAAAGDLGKSRGILYGTACDDAGCNVMGIVSNPLDRFSGQLDVASTHL